MNKTDFILFSGAAAGRRGRVRRMRRASWHRGSELHVRWPQGRPQPRHPRAQPRRAAVRRRQPRVRVAADAPPLHRQSDDPEGPADALVPGQQRPGDLRRRRRSSTTAPCAAERAGAPSSRSCATSRSSCSIRKRTAGSSGPATDWKSRGDDAPVITHPHFTGTGTRQLQDNSRRAIEELFTKSFE